MLLLSPTVTIRLCLSTPSTYTTMFRDHQKPDVEDFEGMSTIQVPHGTSMEGKGDS